MTDKADIPVPEEEVREESLDTSMLEEVKSKAARVFKMPSQAIVTGLTNCQSVVPQIVWSQDPQTVFLRVTITSMRDITHGQVVVGVKDQELTVQVLEVEVSQEGELYTLHLSSCMVKAPPLPSKLHLAAWKGNLSLNSTLHSIVLISVSTRKTLIISS